MSSEDIERRIEFIIEQQARFSADIEQVKAVQSQQAENLNSLTASVRELTVNVDVMRSEMREAINNLIVANEVTRNLAEQATRLAIQTSQRVTNLESS